MGRESNKKRRANTAATAREKAATARAVQARAEQKRRATVVISVVLVLAIVGGIAAYFGVTRSNKTSSIAGNRSVVPASVVSAVESVPTATLDKVGLGSVIAAPKPVTGTTLTTNGKPDLLYIGAEFCPYCAGERWSMAVALSRFGTLSGVKLTTSSSTDVDPNTQTLDFDGTTYSSKYLSFTPVENEDREENPLEKLTTAQTALWNHYTNNSPGFPFLDFANKYIVEGPTYDPKVLAGLTRAEIASKLADPTDPVAKSVDGAANLLTAAICGITDNKPKSVCSDSTISSLLAQINKQGTGTTTTPSTDSTPGTGSTPASG